MQRPQPCPKRPTRETPGKHSESQTYRVENDKGSAMGMYQGGKTTKTTLGEASSTTVCLCTLPGGTTTAVQLERWASWHDSRVHEKLKERQRKKFDCLMLSKRQRQRETLNKDRLVVNLSSQQLTKAQCNVLALGLNFATAPKRVPVVDIIARTEQTTRGLNEKDDQTIREEVQHCLREAKMPEPTLTRTEQGAPKN